MMSTMINILKYYLLLEFLNKGSKCFVIIRCCLWNILPQITLILLDLLSWKSAQNKYLQWCIHYIYMYWFVLYNNSNHQWSLSPFREYFTIFKRKSNLTYNNNNNNNNHYQLRLSACLIPNGMSTLNRV